MLRLTRRRWIQILSTIGMNAYLPAFFTGSISQLRSKGVCIPVLNCYSCPSALFCHRPFPPIGR